MKTEHRPQLLWTSHDNVSIHAKAIPAFNFSQKLRYQIDTSSLTANVLGMRAYEVPIAVKAKAKETELPHQQTHYFIIAGWRALQPSFKQPQGSSLPLLLLSHRHTTTKIEHQAWRYVLQQISLGLDEKRFLSHTAEFAALCPVLSDITQVPTNIASRPHRFAEHWQSVCRHRTARQIGRISNQFFSSINVEGEK